MASQVEPAQLSALTCEARRIAPPPVAAVLRRLASPRLLWSGPAEQTVLGSGAAAVIHATGTDRFTAVQAHLDALWEALEFDGDPRARPRALGGFGFRAETTDAPEWQAFAPAQIVVPQLQVTWADGRAWVTRTHAGQQRAGNDLDAIAKAIETIDADGRSPHPVVGSQHRAPVRAEWEAAIEEVLRRLDGGELDKLVLAQRLRAELDIAPDGAGVLQRLTDRYPRCYRFLIEPVPGTAAGGLGASGRRPPRVVGASPERLLTHRAGTVETDALAGTTMRGETAALDEWLATELLADAKNSLEHDVVVETIAGRLEPYLETVAVDDRRIRRLDTVQHLWTPITGAAVTDTCVLEMVEALHPTPAVGGIPSDEARQMIRRIEPFDRGWYAGPVGWVDAAGDGSFAVAIRSAILEDTVAHCYAGVGLVATSEPSVEWEETQMKFRPMLDALDPSGVSRW